MMPEPEMAGSLENPPPLPPSWGSRIMNVFVAPSEVFDEVKIERPRPANWLLGLSVTCAMTIISVFVLFSQDRIVQSLKEAQEQKFQQKVDAGQMKQEQADQILAITGKFMTPTALKVAGILAGTLGICVSLFLNSLVIWAVGVKVFKGTFTYMKTVEMVGLSFLVFVPSGLISLLLAVIYGDVKMTPGPVLLVSHFNAANKFHEFLSAINLPGVWSIAVMSIGLSRLSGASLLKSAIWGYAIWTVLVLISAQFA